ncbi:hypothetical protein STENM36S_05936 [Streptomyces tendae]
MASSVLTARKPSSPGTPATAPHTRAPTTASEVFSATDSTTALAMPSASSACGSRPHRCGSRVRAASTSPASRARPIAAASRASEVPPTTAQVAAPVSATRAAGERRTACAAAAPRATAPPAHTAVCRAPQPRWSRHSTCSTAPAARPNTATGCPRRGSPRRRSPRRPAAAPYAKTRPARMGSAGHRVGEAPGTGCRAVAAAGHRVVSSLRVSTPWFEESGGESSWLPGFPVPRSQWRDRAGFAPGFLSCRRRWPRKSTTPREHPSTWR